MSERITQVLSFIGSGCSRCLDPPVVDLYTNLYGYTVSYTFFRVHCAQFGTVPAAPGHAGRPSGAVFSSSRANPLAMPYRQAAWSVDFRLSRHCHVGCT